LGCYAQSQEVIELKKKIKKAKESEQIDIYNKLSELYRNIDADSSIIFANFAIKIAEKDGTELQNATAYLNAGVTHRNKGNSKRALEYFLNALLLADKMNNKHLQADIMHKVGVTHLFVKEFKEAITFAKREEAIWVELGDEKGLSAALNLAGLAYSNTKDYDIAERKFNAALEIGLKNNDPELIYKPLVNLGDLFYKMGNGDKAIEYIERSRVICQKTGNKVGLAAAAVNISKAYMLQKKYDKAIIAQQEAIKVATEIQSLPLLRNSYGLSSEIYELSGNHEKALDYHRLYKKIEDSLADKNSRQNITALEAKYANEKQRQAILLLHEQDKFKQIQLYALTIITILAIIAVALLVNGYRIKTKYNTQLLEANKQLTNQAFTISSQRDLIEDINNDMLDSINAAKEIQTALLPTENIPEMSVFDSYFVLNLPRNIVSGDFLWFENVQVNGTNSLFFAIGDCTGHGIPAAFLTMTANSLLTDLIKENPPKQANEILGELNRRFIALFRKQTFSKEGIDIALCKYTPSTQNLMYAGAKIPLYYVHNQKLTVIKPDRVSIGDEQRIAGFHYTNHELTLTKGDTLYFTSDGYQDQFGGSKNKKFMVSRFREFLENLHKLDDLQEQRRLLLREKNLWQNLCEQTDDILVLGIKV
jgi:serine phosphatase RsbU (regulator of sigma subunit)